MGCRAWQEGVRARLWVPRVCALTTPTTDHLHDRALMMYVLFTGALHWPHTTTTESMRPLLAGVSVLACCLGNPAGIDDTYEIDAVELAWHQCDLGDLSACERASELVNADF